MERALRPKSSARKIADQIHEGTSGSQYRMIRAAATSSAATVIAQLYQ